MNKVNFFILFLFSWPLFSYDDRSIENSFLQVKKVVSELRYSVERDKALLKIFTSLKDPDSLHCLKEKIEFSEESPFSLTALVFQQIKDEKIRRKLLLHFKIFQGEATYLRPMTDVDDTARPGGFKTGVVEKKLDSLGFFEDYLKTISLITNLKSVESGKWFREEKRLHCNGGLIINSARPKSLSAKTLHLFRHAGIKNVSMLNGKYRALPGQVLDSALEKVINQDRLHQKDFSKWAGDIKYQEFLKVKDIFPEYRFIVFGDTGQGDIYLMQKMLSWNRTVQEPIFIQGFIHLIRSSELEPKMRREAQKELNIDSKQSQVISFTHYSQVIEFLNFFSKLQLSKN